MRLNGMPKLIETLGLCYLGCVLKRLPISLGELLRWAENEEVTFLRVVSPYSAAALHLIDVRADQGDP